MTMLETAIISADGGRFVVAFDAEHLPQLFYQK